MVYLGSEAKEKTTYKGEKGMDTLRKLLVVVFGIAISMGVSVAVMMNGWGVEPKSWFWIIGASFFGQMLAQVVIETAKRD